MSTRTIIIAEQNPETVMELMGVDQQTAEFLLAIERGEVSGDSIEVPARSS